MSKTSLKGHMNGMDSGEKVAILDAGAQYGKVTSLHIYCAPNQTIY